MEPLYVAYLLIGMAAATVTLIRALPAVASFVRKRHSAWRQHGSSLVRARALLAQRRGEMSALLVPYYQQRLGPNAFPLDGDEVIVPLIAQHHWLPTMPLPLSAVRLAWQHCTIPVPVLDPNLSEKLRNQCGVRIENRPTYRLLAISGASNAPVLEFSSSNYEDYVGTGEALAIELSRALLRVAPKRWSPGLLQARHRRLRLRGAIDEFDLTTRSAPPGIVTLTVVVGQSPSTTVFLIHRRTGPLAEYPGGYSVVPAGTFQPLSENDAFHPVEFSLERSIIREFGEELLNKEQLIAAQGTLDPDQPFRSDEDLCYLSGLFEQGKARVLYLGCALDVVTLKPEVLTMLLVRADALTHRWDRLFDSWEGSYEVVPFDDHSLRRWLNAPNMATAARGLVACCLRHRGPIEDEIEALRQLT